MIAGEKITRIGNILSCTHMAANKGQRYIIGERRRKETNGQQPHDQTKNLQGPQLFNGAMVRGLKRNYSKRYSSLL